MSNMEFLRSNFLNTTTQIVASEGGTSSVANLFNRFTTKKFGSGDASDLTTTTIVLTFTAAINLDRLILQNINFKSFKIFHSGATASTFTLTNAATTVSNWVTNSDTNLYLEFATVSVSKINIECSTTVVANAEKQLGESWITNVFAVMDRNPSAGQYKAKKKPKQFPIEMSDGGVDLYQIQTNYHTDIDLKFVSASQQAQFLSIHELSDHIVFTPEPTGTAWSGDIFAVNWIGDFGLQWSQDFKDTGFNQKMKLREIPK